MRVNSFAHEAYSTKDVGRAVSVLGKFLCEQVQSSAQIWHKVGVPNNGMGVNLFADYTAHQSLINDDHTGEGGLHTIIQCIILPVFSPAAFAQSWT